MTEVSTAAPAASFPREHIEGRPEDLQDLERHLSALRLQAAHCSTPTLRQLMAIEVGLAEACLRRFTIVRE